MIDSKFALKYPMPHSVVHIVDNSGNTEAAGYREAQDPSLLSTIVVTGAPMGEDNKVVTLTRSDVISSAFGMGNLTPADIKKYGQAVTYPMDLVNQGVPVQFMRITPPDATYSAISLVVQWKKDDTDGKLHVRFKIKEWADTIPRSEFKNTQRVNNALVTGFKQEITEGSEVWQQRAFINFIAAGKGKIYNNMASAINIVSQSKRPTNVKYEFVTIDKRTNAVVERFYASLMNTNIGMNTVVNSIDSVNTVVSKRVPGSSIVVPYLNEDAVIEVYDEYMRLFEDKINSQLADDAAKNVYRSMNINIFDMIFGNYIYNGTDNNTKMPFYQVDMETTDLPKLDSNKLVSTLVPSETQMYDFTRPEVLRNKLIDMSIAISDPESELFVGDLYLTKNVSGKLTNPKVSIITSVNQYTGVVTSMHIPKVFPLGAESGIAPDVTYDWTTLDKTISRPIDMYTANLEDGRSEDIDNAIRRDEIGNKGIVAVIDKNDNSNFDLYTIEITDATNAAKPQYTLHKYPAKLLYEALDRSSHTAGVVGTGNAFGFDKDSSCWNRVGSAVIIPNTGDDTTLPTVMINGYDRKVADADESKDENIVDGTFDVTKNRIPVNRLTGKHVGVIPGVINHSNISGESFDILVYPDTANNIDKWVVKSVGIKIDADGTTYGGTGYNVGDILYIPIDDEDAPREDGDGGTIEGVMRTKVRVTAINPATGAIRNLEMIENGIYSPVAGTAPTPTEAIANDYAPAYVDSTVVAGGIDAKIVIKEFSVVDGKPREIERFVVSGSYGSLYAILNTHSSVPANYYNAEQGDNPTSAVGGMSLKGGWAGFFDDSTISSVEYKWRYSELLVKALRGEGNFDRRILSSTRVPAKFMFDAGYNTIVSSSFTSNIAEYKPIDVINSSIIFTDEEKDQVLFYPEKTLGTIDSAADIDVKRAMYDLMIHRCYDGIPEDMRPIGPGSGLQLYLDSGVTDADTTTLIRDSFIKRFDNGNAIWDIGGFVEAGTGISYTYVKHIVEDLFRHINVAGINKPYAGQTSSIPRSRYSSFFPDLDTTDWGQRANLYQSGGNAWIMQKDGALQRRSQVTLKRDGETSDLLQENNVRTLSRLVYLLQEKIDSYLLEYNGDSTIKSLQDEVSNMFSNWVGNYVDALDITFQRDKNIDGAEILVCYCNVTFRGLILRVPIIVNVNARQE